MLKNYREIRLFEEILESGLNLRVKVTGRSMAPFLRGGEILTIKKEPLHALRKGDLIFFKNSQGTPLLHRIIQKRKSSNEKITFRTKGDALMALDEPVQYQKVLGKVCRIEKTSSGQRAKCINMESRKWRMINAIIAQTGVIKSHLKSALTFFRKRFNLQIFHRGGTPVRSSGPTGQAKCAEKNTISFLLRGQNRNN